LDNFELAWPFRTFGLNPGIVQERFTDYIERFNLAGIGTFPSS
jgi:hypothetical protein